MTIEEVQSEIIEEFQELDEAGMDRYEYLLELSSKVPEILDENKTDEHLIEGCQSKVWLYAELIDGKIHFSADSNTALTKGIISLLIRILSERTPEEIMNAELDFIDRLGIRNFLSAQRANGLLAMLKQMKLYAIAFNAQIQNQ